jgi:hypothetical protein
MNDKFIPTYLTDVVFRTIEDPILVPITALEVEDILVGHRVPAHDPEYVLKSGAGGFHGLVTGEEPN